MGWFIYSELQLHLFCISIHKKDMNVMIKVLFLFSFVRCPNQEWWNNCCAEGGSLSYGELISRFNKADNSWQAVSTKWMDWPFASHQGWRRMGHPDVGSWQMNVEHDGNILKCFASRSRFVCTPRRAFHSTYTYVDVWVRVCSGKTEERTLCTQLGNALNLRESIPFQLRKLLELKT